MAFQGPMNPMLNLAKLLISRGLRVTIAATEMARHHIINSNPIAHNSQIQIEFFSDGLSLDFDRLKYSDDFFDSLKTNGSSIKNILQDLFQSLDKAQWVLATSFDEIEEEIVKAMDYLIKNRSIGPLVSPFLVGQKETDDLSINLWNNEDSCMGWLDDKPDCSVIYISFGSVIVFTQKQIDNIVMALRNTEKSFLWVVKPARKHCEEDDSAKLPNEFLEEMKKKETGLVVTWCPQEKVPMHRSVGCFMTHCGWNSTAETVVAGVPVIAYPKWSDQPTNAKLCGSVFENSVKVNFEEDGNVSAEQLERCIRKVMEDPEGNKMKKKALKLKDAARKVLQEGGSSHNNVNQFIGELVLAKNQASA
ncbi:UDP-glycosyltransferase 84B2-like [Neltuma alba]|uniref:UDP-glycosyltransferase 84B2-like n=1 Tax=Neltuma alba TaxID=207710 RepID=UPI0010A4B038|nr:UDP-glycosyltransferase 84B2-like [Prosopis alba]